MYETLEHWKQYKQEKELQNKIAQEFELFNECGFQYKLPKRRPFEDIGYEKFITDKGHRLNNCEWMVHNSNEIITN